MFLAKTNHHQKSFYLLKGLWRKLPNSYKFKVFISLLLMIASSLSEIISLGSLLPFLTILTEPNNIWDYQIIRSIASFYSINTQQELLEVVIIIFILATVLAALIRLSNLWFITRLSASIGSYFGSESFKRTLYQDYSVHINRNTSEVISAITLQINRTVLVINQILLFFTALLVTIGLVYSLVIINSKVTVFIISVFTISYLFIALFTRRKLADNSALITSSSNKQVQSLQEGLGSIREILLNSTYELYLKKYRKADINMRLSQAENQVIASFPRYAIEAIGIVLIAGLAWRLNYNSPTEKSIIPILGIIGFASQKLLPAIQQIYASWANFRSYSSSVSNVLEFLEQPINKQQFNLEYDKSIFCKSIEARRLSFNYLDDQPYILKDINLVIKKGERIGIVGETGSGKSTLLDILMGLLLPSTGKILIDGKQFTDSLSFSSWRALVSHVPQTIYLSDSSFAENIAFGVHPKSIDYSKVKQVAQKAHISNMIESSLNGYKTFVGERGIRMSGGEKQRLAIARALYSKCELLVLDEPTSALDLATEKSLMETIDSLDKELTIIIVAHRLSTLKNCDRVIKLIKGRIVQIKSKDDLL